MLLLQNVAKHEETGEITPRPKQPLSDEEVIYERHFRIVCGCANVVILALHSKR